MIDPETHSFSRAFSWWKTRVDPSSDRFNGFLVFCSMFFGLGFFLPIVIRVGSWWWGFVLGDMP